jgi:hypothetical protein
MFVDVVQRKQCINLHQSQNFPPSHRENERIPVSSLTDGLKRVMTDEERVDLWLVGMVRSRRR